jgi:murein DD-endopeptidase MepM/ murein hydrolase activator NlpD
MVGHGNASRRFGCGRRSVERALVIGCLVLASTACIPAARAQQRGLVMPVSPACVSSPFGPRVLPGKPLAGTYHYGIDLPAPAGAPVRAIAAGEVITLHRRGAGGLEVVLRHPGGFTTMYAHLGSVTPALAEGKRQVAAGETLGVVGRTGVSYGTHVYFELRVNGERVDPAPYLAVARCK